MFRNILAEMARNNYSRLDIASKLGVSDGTLRTRLNGLSDFTLPEIRILIELFDKPFEYLFEEMQAEKTA